MANVDAPIAEALVVVVVTQSADGAQLAEDKHEAVVTAPALGPTAGIQRRMEMHPTAVVQLLPATKSQTRSRSCPRKAMIGKEIEARVEMMKRKGKRMETHPTAVVQLLPA